MNQYENNYLVESSPAPAGNGNSDITVMVLGIVGLATSFCCGIGLVPSIIGLVLSMRYKKEYGSGNTKVNVGFGLSIGGVVVGALFVTFLLCYLGCVCVEYACYGTMAASSLANSYSYY